MDKQTEEQLEVFSHYLTEEPLGAWRGCLMAFGGVVAVVTSIIIAIMLHH